MSPSPFESIFRYLVFLDEIKLSRSGNAISVHLNPAWEIADSFAGRLCEGCIPADAVAYATLISCKESKSRDSDMRGILVDLL